MGMTTPAKPKLSQEQLDDLLQKWVDHRKRLKMAHIEDTAKQLARELTVNIDVFNQLFEHAEAHGLGTHVPSRKGNPNRFRWDSRDDPHTGAKIDPPDYKALKTKEKKEKTESVSYNPPRVSKKLPALPARNGALEVVKAAPTPIPPHEAPITPPKRGFKRDIPLQSGATITISATTAITADDFLQLSTYFTGFADAMKSWKTA